MNFLLSMLAVLLLIAAAWLTACCEEIKVFILFVLPYLSAAVFISGTLYRVVKWSRSPVPFRIPTTSGQQKSLEWLKNNNLENPHNAFGVIGKMLLEIFFFRSLFRNTRFELEEGQLAYGSTKLLWLGGLIFHWSLFIILLRHLRFFSEPIPVIIKFIQDMDGLFEIGLPPLFITTALITLAILYLLIRRFADPLVRYISLAADFFPLLLIFSIVITGIIMRHFIKVDLFTAKKYILSLLYFSPVRPDGVGDIFHIHLFLVCALAIYMPFSKLIHFAGVFLSPTRNLASTNRIRRHINPWNPPVKVHTYEEWENEFRDKLKASGYKLEKE